ncbi:MAG: hypothetical protein PW845_05545 [Pseudomonas sp.]|nr:hypothetical protein [Pseudomonas sp. PIA16]MDE1164852.1 hypothetical protein [Pseudomonas sp.]
MRTLTALLCQALLGLAFGCLVASLAHASAGPLTAAGPVPLRLLP